MRCLGAILAAGRSTRFGAEDKLLAPWRGRPLVGWAAEALVASGCDEVIAVISAPEVGAVLPDGFTLHRIAPGLPMSASFKLALRIARDRQADGLLLCLGDMPNVDAGLLRRLRSLPGSGACLAAGRRMPPAYIAAGDFDRALDVEDGDHGARSIIAALPETRLIRIDKDAAHDVDRPSDLTRPG